MKRFIQIFSLLILMGFSFFYTKKTTKIIKSMDNLMKYIEQDKSKYYIKPIDAYIKDNNIIPGLSGREVNVDLSYEKIKKVGKYSPSLLIYNEIKPSISINNRYDKYIISGNQNKKEVTLIFKVRINDDISIIKEILDNNNTKASFFIDKDWFNNNIIITNKLIKEEYIIGNLDRNIWLNTVINKINNQKISFCYTEENDNNLLNKCMMNNSYTIKPNIIIKNNPFLEIKKELNNGSIISFNINDITIKELPLIIKYINSKGYKINNLKEFIKE